MGGQAPGGAVFFLLAFACDGGSNYGYAGFDMVDHFPLDGQREWRYSNSAYDYNLEVELSDETTVAGDLIVHKFEYYSEANGNLLWDMSFSSDTINGVQVHGYTVHSEDGGGGDTGDTGGDDTDDSGGAEGPEEVVQFSPPLILAEDQMVPGDSVVTETGGINFVATFHHQVDCPNDWMSGANTWKCLYVTVDDGDGDDLTGSKAAGGYWIAPRYGMSWFQQTGDTDKWVLGEADWAP